MSPAELVELALDIGNRIDVQWGLFVTVHMALLNAAYADIHQMTVDGNASELVKRLASEHLAGRHKYSSIVVNVSHGLMLVLVTLAIIYHPLMTRKD